MRENLRDMLCRLAWIGSTAALCVHLIYGEPALAAAYGPELRPVKITGYCLRGKTASGIQTREGICAYRKVDIGKMAIVYGEDMELIGVYEIQDTGAYNVRKGYILDIWCKTKEECNQLTQEGWVQIVDAEG